MFAFQDRRGDVDVAFTDRHGGVSGGPYASLNLAQSGDDAAATAENVRLATQAFAGASAPRRAPPVVARMHQVHGAHVEVAGSPGLDECAQPVGRAPPECDGLITRQAGVVLMVRVADCAPVLLADVERGVIGAAHVGRLGMLAGIIPATVERMRDLGAHQIAAWVGPHVCGRCYEVPAAMREEVSRAIPEAYAETSWGTPSVDIGAGVRAQLEADRVETIDIALCTMEEEDLYSHRRQGPDAGRLAGLVWIRP